MSRGGTRRPVHRFRRFQAALAAATLLCTAPLLGGCAGGGSADDADAVRDAKETSSSTARVAVDLEGGWAKAGAADGMTGVFGSLVNHGPDDVTITGVTSDAASEVELHEVVGGEMREIAGDAVIPAGGSFELVPGGDHIMLMGLTRELLAGDELSLDIALSDGTTLTATVLVKDYAGAQEEYGDGEGVDGHGMGGEDHSSH